MDLCGHREFAGPSACVLEEGHNGKHKYGDIALAYEVEMRKDAERYRFLRDGCVFDMEDTDAPQLVHRDGQREGDPPRRDWKQRLDDAIDAAMRKTPNAEVTGGPLAARPVDCRVRGEKSALAGRQEKGQE